MFNRKGHFVILAPQASHCRIALGTLWQTPQILLITLRFQSGNQFPKTRSLSVYLNDAILQLKTLSWKKRVKMFWILNSIEVQNYQYRDLPLRSYVDVWAQSALCKFKQIVSTDCKVLRYIRKDFFAGQGWLMDLQAQWVTFCSILWNMVFHVVHVFNSSKQSC